MREIRDEFQALVALNRKQEAGFNFFFQKHRYELFRFAQHYLECRDLGDEAMIIAFTRLWERPNEYKHPKAVKAWLYTVTLNECRLIKQNKVRLGRKMGEYSSLLPLPVQDSPLDISVRKEMQHQTVTCMYSLPPGCKKVMENLFLNELTVRQTSAELGLELSTIKNQKARGLSLMRERFHMYG